MHIMTAANQTRGYLEATARGKARDIEREHTLSNLGNICGVAIREFDQDLSRRCDLKAEYWRNPHEWTVAAVHEAKIGLANVTKEAEYLLRLKCDLREVEVDTFSCSPPRNQKNLPFVGASAARKLFL